MYRLKEPIQWRKNNVLNGHCLPPQFLRRGGVGQGFFFAGRGSPFFTGRGGASIPGAYPVLLWKSCVILKNQHNFEFLWLSFVFLYNCLNQVKLLRPALFKREMLMFQERFFLFVKSKTYDHNCLAEKYKTKAPQWKNLFSTFWHKIIKESILFGLLNEFICWWSPSKYWWYLLVILTPLIDYMLKYSI